MAQTAAQGEARKLCICNGLEPASGPIGFKTVFGATCCARLPLTSAHHLTIALLCLSTPLIKHQLPPRYRLVICGLQRMGARSTVGGTPAVTLPGSRCQVCSSVPCSVRSACTGCFVWSCCCPQQTPNR